MSSSATSTRKRTFGLAAAGLAVTVFVAVLGWLYQGRFTLATIFWVIGWGALLGACALIYKAAQAFQLGPSAADLEPLATVGERRRADLDRERKALLKAIKEVEFDRDMGKLDDADAEVVISRYRARAREVIKLLDGDTAYETQVEKELARRMADAPPPPAAAKPQVAPAPVCKGCQTVNDNDAEFCKKCGGKLR
jgi:hypothetical protein